MRRTPSPTVADGLAWAAAALERIDGDPAREAVWILESIIGRRAAGDRRRPLAPREVARLRSDVARRARGEPLAYVIGTAPFRGIEVEVGTGVLIPRPETEGLVDLALGAIAGRRAPRVLEIGTGSAAVALALARERPDAEIVATENAPAALGWARRNVERLGGRVRVVEADLFPPGDETFDLIVTNPPYIADGEDLPPAVDEWEPPEALRAGPDGLAVWRRVLEGAPARLAAGGALVGEVHEDRSADVAALGRAAGLVTEIRRDLFGKPRYVVGWASDSRRAARRRGGGGPTTPRAARIAYRTTSGRLFRASRMRSPTRASSSRPRSSPSGPTSRARTRSAVRTSRAFATAKSVANLGFPSPRSTTTRLRRAIPAFRATSPCERPRARRIDRIAPPTRSQSSRSGSPPRRPVRAMRTTYRTFIK